MSDDDVCCYILVGFFPNRFFLRSSFLGEGRSLFIFRRLEGFVSRWVL